EYQRQGSVWTLEKKQLLIDSILNDYDLPKIYFHELEGSEIKSAGYRFSVIDGRQRLETIWAFLDDEFTLADDFEYQRDRKIDLAGLSYNDIANQYPKIKIKIDSFVLPIVTVTTSDGDLDLIEDMFSRLNEAVPLNAAEKRNAFTGPMVLAIRKVSTHPFFNDSVRFSNKRYQYLEISARMLLTEHSLQRTGKLTDTKKVYLDSMTKDYVGTNSRVPAKLRAKVIPVLNAMKETFTKKDELLAAQGNMIIYYLIHRFAMENDELSKITRNKLLKFRKKLAKNRKIAEESYTDSSFALLEYDRLSQQGTNDASNIKERYSILAYELGLTANEF
ncbi:MAG: DUF262 domain-containing protein, partial [Gilvibacter sp.]